MPRLADLLGDRRRASDRPIRLGEGGEEAVAGVVFLLPPEALELGPDEPVEAGGEFAVPGITHLGGDVRRPHHIEHQHRGDPPIGHGRSSSRPRPGSTQPWADLQGETKLLRDEVGERPRRPEVLGDRRRIAGDPSPSEVLADPFDVACQERLGVPVLLRIDGLREVDHGDLALPHEDVERRQVAVDHVVEEHPLDRTDALLEEILGLRVARGPISMELRRGVVLVADVRHEDRVVGGFDRAGDGRPRREQRCAGSPIRARPRSPPGPPVRIASSSPGRRGSAAP